MPQWVARLEPDEQRQGALVDVPHCGGAHADRREVDESLRAGGLDARAVAPHCRRVAQHAQQQVEPQENEHAEDGGVDGHAALERLWVGVLGRVAGEAALAGARQAHGGQPRRRRVQQRDEGLEREAAAQAGHLVEVGVEVEVEVVRARAAAATARAVAARAVEARAVEVVRVRAPAGS